MAKYITKFETIAEYTAAESSLATPQVSLVKETMTVNYKPIRVVTKYNVTSTSSPTKIVDRTAYFSSIEIDGVVQPSVVSAYTFDTLGEHTIKYKLADPTNIGVAAFKYCSNLTSVSIPNSVTSIGLSAFTECISLTSITVDSNNTVYDSRNNCNAIIKTSTNELVFGCNNTVIPNGVTSIGVTAFFGCSGLTSIDIPDSVTSIGGGAFYGCTSLTSINIPNGVTSIGRRAFEYCSGLTSVYIPRSVTYIGTAPFAYCSSLTSITVDSNNAVYDSRNNCNAIILAEYVSDRVLIQGCKTTVIPTNIYSIDNLAFAGCDLISITIPDNIGIIRDSVFYDCKSLTSCTIGSRVKSIGHNAFTNCLRLKRLTSLSATAPSIYSDTFKYIGSFGTLYVPKNSSGYDDTWMSWSLYYLGAYNWLMRTI